MGRVEGGIKEFTTRDERRSFCDVEGRRSFRGRSSKNEDEPGKDADEPRRGKDASKRDVDGRKNGKGSPLKDVDRTGNKKDVRKTDVDRARNGKVSHGSVGRALASSRNLVLALAGALTACTGGHTPSKATPVASSASSPSSAALAVPPVFPPDWPFPAGAPAPHGARGMVSCDAALATKAGVDVLSTGGNAVDAAVATALALAVVFPTAGNLGGGGFLVARVGGETRALDFRETAPAAATHDMYKGSDGKPTRDSRFGWRAVGVPGSVAGLWEAWHALGSKRKTWAEVVAPAIALADHGFPVDAPFAATIEMMKLRLAKDPASAALFLPDGAAPAMGVTWRNPQLADVLRRVAEQGPSGFYEGPVAEAIGSAMKKAGGIVTAEDLKAYRAKWRPPVDYTYRGSEVIGMPLPSSGGVTMAMIAHILDGFDLRSKGWHTAAQVHLTAEAMRRAFAARNEKLGDPDFVKSPVDELLSPGWADAQRSTIRVDHATATKDLLPASASQTNEGPHTTHLSVVDSEGNAVALTTTLNAWFGAGVTVPGLGLVLNDEMDDFSSVPGQPNMFGLVQGEQNAIAPGKRMLSSMSPTIVLGKGGEVELVLGAAGGSRIITAVFEELSNALDFGMDAADAVRAPRFHQQDLPDVLELELRALPESTMNELQAMGHQTKEVEHLADAPGLGRDKGLWIGAAEPRRDGSLALGL
jgi:gamma-glutamyltranspeptidase/glutathione hydrolase